MPTDTPTITELAEDQHWWFATRTWSLLNLLDAHVPRRDGDVLDIGCGAGNMIHHLSRYGRVKGVEVDARPVAMAKRKTIPIFARRRLAVSCRPRDSTTRTGPWLMPTSLLCPTLEMGRTSVLD